MNYNRDLLYTDLEVLARKAKIRPPRLHIVPVEAPFGAVLTISGRGDIFLSRGLLQRLNRSEAAAVLAHEVAHLYHHDTVLRLFALWAFGLATIWTGIIYTTLAMPSMGGIAAFISWLGALSILREQEWRADRTGACLLGESESLARAIEKVYGKSSRAWLGGLFCTHPPPGLRIERLRAMKIKG